MDNKIVIGGKASLYRKSLEWLEEVQYKWAALRACPEQIARDLIPELDRLSLIRLLRTTDHPAVAVAALRQAQREGMLRHLSLLKLVLAHRYPAVRRQAAYYLLSQPTASALHPAARAQVGNLNLYQAFKKFGPVGRSFDVKTRQEDGWSRRFDPAALPTGWVFEFNCRSIDATWFQLEQDARFRLRQCIEEYRAMPKHAQYVRMESEDSAILTRDEGTVARVYRVGGM